MTRKNKFMWDSNPTESQTSGTKRGWPEEQKADFVQWHERRMIECEYPPAVVAELRKERDKWLAN